MNTQSAQIIVTRELVAYSGDSDHRFWFYPITDLPNAMDPIVSL